MEIFNFNLQRFDADDAIKGTDGDDNISGGGSDTAIDGGAGNDSIVFDGDNNTILGGDGNDNISNNGYSNSIDGGADDDNIAISGYNNTINGGDGNDSIENWGGNNVTILGGAGNDYVYNHYRDGTVYIYGGGNDTLEAFRDDNNFLIIEGYTWSTLSVTDEYGNYTGEVIVNVLNGAATVGSITLKDLPLESINILSSKEELANINLIINEEDGKNITSTDGKSNITNTARNLFITSGAENDSIYSHGTYTTGDFVTIDAGDGDNFIYNSYKWQSSRYGLRLRRRQRYDRRLQQFNKRCSRRCQNKIFYHVVS